MTFEDFFRALYPGKEPFPWQRKLAAVVTAGNWPRLLALPTASGKTACIDIAVYALAVQHNWPHNLRTAPRRVFFVVDRRVIVDEAHERMREIAKRLLKADSGVLKEAADRLRTMAGDPDGEPLTVHELRGAIYRDNAWVRNPAQPALIASTVDQVGSRLLFRGYGVSDSARPIHAALIANDALIILDEAHCSHPFGQTLETVRSYRELGGIADAVRMPFHVVKMSATPSREVEEARFDLTDEDRGDKYLGPRLKARKPTELVQAGKKQGRSDRDSVAESLAEQALRLAEEDGRLKNIVVFANRVATARAVRKILDRKEHRCELLIGRMRPIDRDGLTEGLNGRLRSGERQVPEDTLFVASTQCLEVGADFDFDALVTECASIDALRQRFGRVNRLGRKDIEARAVVVAPPGKLDGDPIYGDAIRHTWEWLKKLAGETSGKKPVVDFAIEGTGTVGEALEDSTDISHLRREEANAPVLFREYLDIWSQTNPAPSPEPEVGLFLHGPDNDSPEIQVVWRADLDEGNPDDWVDTVSLCPPTIAEAMSVPLSAFRRWIQQESDSLSEIADVAALAPAADRRKGTRRAKVFLRWRGTRNGKKRKDESIVTQEVSDVKPGDTLIIPASYEGWNDFGYRSPINPIDRVDRAEEAILHLGRNPVLRLHKSIIDQWPGVPKNLVESLNEESDWGGVLEILVKYRDGLAEDQWPKKVLQFVDNARVEWTPYPDGKGLVVRSKGDLRDEDDGEDDLCATKERVDLRSHTEHVCAWVADFAGHCGLDAFLTDFKAAARCHDWGKADERFQALLLGGDRIAARFSARLWAKSAQMSLSRRERHRQRELSGLPDGFRHELFSLQMAGSSKVQLEGDRDLILHLIATHHGWARPFAPVVEDTELPGADLSAAGERLSWPASERTGLIPPHALASGVTERFWRLTSRFGWWGVAYLETIFRLGDWTASERLKAPRREAIEEAA